MNTFAIILLVVTVNSVIDENRQLQLLYLICTSDALSPKVRCPNDS